MTFEIIAILSTLIFGSLTIFLSVKEEKTKKLLEQEEKNHRQRLYEVTLLKDIQDKIGYSLDVEKVMDVITGSLRNLFSYSTATSLIVTDAKLIIKTYAEERVSRKFINQVHESLLASYSTISGSVSSPPVEERVSGVILDESNTQELASFFHIPLIVLDKVVGIITVSSVKPHLYREEEMTILYQIAGGAGSALSKLQSVLSQEKGKLTAMIGSLADGLFMIDVNNQLTLINAAAKAHLRITKENPTILDVMSMLPNTLDFGGKIQQAMTANQTIKDLEIQLFDHTFQVFIIPVSYTVQSTSYLGAQAREEVIGVSVVLHDVTLEKNLSTLKEDFTNMIVHNLRAPLNSIKGASQLLRDDHGLSDEEKTKLLTIIDEQSRKLLDEVASILDASKLQSGRFEVDKKPGSIRDVIEERIDIFHPLAQNKHIVLIGQVDKNLPDFSFDQRYVGQAINNLISNALKFTPPGGRITVSGKMAEQAGFVVVAVSDTGAGIPKDQQEKLFSKFSQLSHAPHANGSGLLTTGTGLGLFIVKGIVEAHGGSVGVSSEPGIGTTISFTLPTLKSSYQTPQRVAAVSLLGQSVN